MISDSVTIAPDVRLYYELRSSSSTPSAQSDKLLMIMGAFATLKHFEEQAEYILEAFRQWNRSVEILTYDHRGIGKSASTAPAMRQTSRLLAQDALALIEHVWGKESSIHVYGASLGGMVAQELALLLIPSNRLKSLYLAVTSRGSYIRPMAFGPTIWSKMMPFLIKKDPEQMVRRVLLPSSFSPTTLASQGEIYAKRWIDEYDQWWAFGNPQACASQCSVAASHYLTDEGIRLISSAKIPITVQIATRDQLMSPAKQRQLAASLAARTVVFDHGHLGDDEVKKQLFQSSVDHLKHAIGIE